MTLINKNLKFLRTRKGLTQKQFAEELGVKTSAIGAYEEGRAIPPLPLMIQVAEMFQLSLDALTRDDLEVIPEKKWLEQQYGRGREVLAITVDPSGKENIELVSQKASAGYLNGYQDPEYIQELPKISLPILSRNATHRAFEVQGDSMLPIQPGSLVFGEYLDNIMSIKNGKPYVLVTRQEGIVFKRIFNFLQEKESLLLVSDNRHYSPYLINGREVLEVWRIKGYFSTHFDPDVSTDIYANSLANQILSLQEALKKFKN